MDSLLPLCTRSTTSAAANSFSTEFSLPCFSQSRRLRNLAFVKKPRNFLVFASKDEPPKLDEWEQMELKFGKMLGEDPKLVLAKVTFFSLCFFGFRKFSDVFNGVVFLCHLSW